MRKVVTQSATPWSIGVGRSISRASISSKAGGFIDGGELLGRRVPVAGFDRRRVAADDQLLVERLAQLREIALAAHLAGEAAARLQRAEDRRAPPAPCRAPSAASRWRRPRRTRRELSCPPRRISTRVDARWPAPPRPSRANCRCRRTVAPRSTIFSVSVPSPQPTSRICSPGCGSSRSSAAAAKLGDERADLRIIGGDPICWSRRWSALKASSPTRGRRLRPSARRARPGRRA